MPLYLYILVRVYRSQYMGEHVYFFTQEAERFLFHGEFHGG